MTKFLAAVVVCLSLANTARSQVLMEVVPTLCYDEWNWVNGVGHWGVRIMGYADLYYPPCFPGPTWMVEVVFANPGFDYTNAKFGPVVWSTAGRAYWTMWVRRTNPYVDWEPGIYNYRCVGWYTNCVSEPFFMIDGYWSDWYTTYLYGWYNNETRAVPSYRRPTDALYRREDDGLA